MDAVLMVYDEIRDMMDILDVEMKSEQLKGECLPSQGLDHLRFLISVAKTKLVLLEHRCRVDFVKEVDAVVV